MCVCEHVFVCVFVRVRSLSHTDLNPSSVEFVSMFVAVMAASVRG